MILQMLNSARTKVIYWAAGVVWFLTIVLLGVDEYHNYRKGKLEKDISKGKANLNELQTEQAVDDSKSADAVLNYEQQRDAYLHGSDSSVRQGDSKTSTPDTNKG